MTEAEIRADERKKIAAFVAAFSWVLPLYGNPQSLNKTKRNRDIGLNKASDNAACMVCEQIAAAILAMT